MFFKIGGLGDIIELYRCVESMLPPGSSPAPAGVIQITWIVDQSAISLLSELIRTRLEVNHLVHIKLNLTPFDAKGFFTSSILGRFSFALKLWFHFYKNRDHDLALFHRNFVFKMLAKFAGIRKVYSVSGSLQHPEMRVYQGVLKQFGWTEYKAKDEIPANPTIQSPCAVVFALGGGRSVRVDYLEKTYPNAVQALDVLRKDDRIDIITVLGLSSEVDSNTLAQILQWNDPKIDWAVDRYRLEELPVVLEEARFFIGADSALLHLAGLVMQAPSQRVIGLFGPTDPKIWAPMGPNVRTIQSDLDCQPCYKNDGKFDPCSRPKEEWALCMKQISPKNIIQSIFDAD